MGREPRDDVEREIRALELRIGVDHHGNIDRVRDGAKIGFDLAVTERKIRFQDRQNAVGAELLAGFGLGHRIRRRGRGDAGVHRHAASCHLDRGLHHGLTLRVVEIGKLAGRAERRQSVHAGLDEIVAKTAEHIGADLACGIDGRDEIGEDAVEIGHGPTLEPAPRPGQMLCRNADGPELPPGRCRNHQRQLRWRLTYTGVP